MAALPVTQTPKLGNPARARPRSVGHPRRKEGPIFARLFCSDQRSSGAGSFLDYEHKHEHDF